MPCHVIPPCHTNMFMSHAVSGMLPYFTGIMNIFYTPTTARTVPPMPTTMVCRASVHITDVRPPSIQTYKNIINCNFMISYLLVLYANVADLL